MKDEEIRNANPLLAVDSQSTVEQDPDLTLSFVLRHSDGRIDARSPESSDDARDTFCRGAVLDGRYVLEQELGRGGMGMVYFGRDSRLDRVVAVKAILPPKRAHSEQEESRARTLFEQEARLGAALLHPAIATVFDYGFQDGKPYTVFEYIPGETLRDVMKRRGRLPLEEVQEIVSHLAQALDYAHSHHIVHRDLKPENIRVTVQGQYKILDLGLAKRFTQDEGWQFAGTPAYASPEQAAGEPSDGRTDQYALGIIAYELLTGTRPFISRNIKELLEMHRSHAPTPPKSRLAEIPEHVSQAILRALEKDSANRFDSCLQLAAAMGRGGETGTAASSRIERAADVEVRCIKLNDRISPLLLTRRQRHGRLALTDNELWLSLRGQVYLWPLTHFASNPVHNRLTFTPHSNASRNLLVVNFESKDECAEWCEAIEQRRRKAAVSNDGRASEIPATFRPDRPPIIWLRRPPVARCQLLGGISARASTRWKARDAITLEAAANHADAVTSIEEERFEDSSGRGWRISAVPVRALTDDGRIAMGSQQFAGDVRLLSMWMIAYAVLMLFASLATNLFAANVSANSDASFAVIIASQLFLWGTPLALAASLLSLRWPEVAKPTSIAFLAIGVAPLLQSFGVAVRTGGSLRMDGIGDILDVCVLLLLVLLSSNFSTLLVQTVPCVGLAVMLWRVQQRTRRWHRQPSRRRLLIGGSLGAISLVYVIVLAIAHIALYMAFGQADALRHRDLGISALQDEEYDVAIERFGKAMYFDPSLQEARRLRAEAFYGRAVARSARHGDSDLARAKEDLDILLRHKPQDGAANLLMGLICAAQGDTESALAAFDQATNINPNDDSALFERARVLIDKQRDYERAVTDLDAVIRLNPENGAAYFNRGLCHEQLGNVEKARDDFARAKELGVEPAEQAAASTP